MNTAESLIRQINKLERYEDTTGEEDYMTAVNILVECRNFLRTLEKED